MLPSSGYFRGIACPGQLRGACNRPYCHFRHDMKVSTEKSTSLSSSSSQAAVATPVQEEADAVEEAKQEEVEQQIMSRETSECSSASPTPAVTTPSEPDEQQSQPHTSQQQEPTTASGEVPKSEILQQLMSEALKKVLAENPTLASTVDASSIRIGIDPVTQEPSEVSKTKKQLYHRPPDTPSYNPTPIRELKKRKQSVDGVHSLVYSPACSGTTGGKGSGDEGGGDVMGEFSSDESEETEEKNDDFDLLEEVLAEHSKNNKVKVKKKKVKELGKLQYSLSNAHKATVDNNIMITDAKKLSDKEVKKYELPQTESVNKIITDGPYFLPPSPIFTSSSDGFEVFSARATHQEEEASVAEHCVDKASPHTESPKANSQPATEKKTTPKQSTEQPKASSQPENAEKVTKASGHAHLPQLLSARGAPKLSRPNVRTWTPLVRNNMPASETQKTTDQLDEILQLMDGSDASSKRKLKENEPQSSNQRDPENARPKKKYKVDLNKEIESLSNPALEHSKESETPEEPANQQPEPSDDQDSDRKSAKEEGMSDEKETTKKPSPKKLEEKEQTDESEAASVESEDSEDDTLSEESGDDSEYKRSRHRKKRKRKRSRSSSSGSDYSHHRRKKRKRSRKRHRKRGKKSRRRRDSTSSVSDQSQESEEEREEKKNDDDGEEEKEKNDDTEEEEENEEEDKENKSKEDSESEDEEDSNDDIEHTKKSKRHRKKHKYYKKLKHRRNKHKARRKRKRSKSYSRSRSTGKSRDSSRSRSRSGSRSRSSSKHRKKRNRSRHKSRNYSDSDNRDSSKENSRSRSSSRSSSKHKRRRGSREDDSSGSRHRESSKSKDKRVDEESNKNRKEDRRRERSSSKLNQQSNDDKKSKNHIDEEMSIPLPVDPSKIKVEKNALVPDLSKVKIEKEDPPPEKSNSQGSVSAKDSGKSKESSCKGQSESSQSKVAEKIPEQRRSSSEDKNKRRKSHERKDSTESTSDKAPHRRQSCDSKASDNEGSLQRKKTEERRSSAEKIKKSQSINSQPSGMSMFDLVLASAETVKPAKTLTEISMFDSVDKGGTDHSLETSGTKNKGKDASHKGSGENAISSEHKSSSSDKTSKSSRSDKTDSHHRHTKSDSKPSHSTSKSKSSSTTTTHHSSSSSSHHTSSSSSHHNSSSSSHHSSSSSSHHSSSSHKRTSSTSSSKSTTSKHHPTSTTTTTSSTTTTATTTTPSSISKTSDSSSRSRKPSDSNNSKSEKESSKHSSTSSRKHSSSSSKHHDSRRSSSSSKHRDSKETTTETTKNNVGSETSKKRRVSADDDSPGGVSDNDQQSSGVDSPLPDLSMLDEISQDDWEQMISGMDGGNHEPSEEGDDVDTDNPWVLEECMKMFNEFQPEENHLENQVLPKKVKAAAEGKEPPKSVSKHRVARSSTGNLMAKKSSRSCHQKTSPMQMMVERYQKLKEQLKMKEKQLHHLQGGPSSVTSSSSSKTSAPTPSSSSSSSHHSSSSQSSGKSKKRIAHVPNVNSLLSAHEKIKKQSHSSASSRISPKVARASGVIPETTAHTVAKGGKRIAHMPKIGALAKPIIQPELGSLVPQNIRQRYLNALIEECKKFTSEKESFNIAAAEERVCYKRAPSRMVYLNLVVNAVKRLRTQQEAGEEAQELMDQDPQLAEKMCIEEANPSTIKPSPPASSPSSSRPHPINPNHVHLSHTTVLSSGGIKGSWSIEKPKKSSASQEDIKGNAFYKNLTKYILTEEQLEENGYPCPDPEEKGKAIVKKIDTRKKISPSALERYCDRCSTLYTVDKWGFPKNSAPCVYHWGRAYKKRKYGTFETSYSCCGGEQGSGGCSQATTHVSENYNPKNLRGYVRTISKDSSSSNKEVYALDCEMCYTTEGNELTRITVINSNGDVVYEQLVKPENPILDYNTRFSGITENDMEDVKLTIRDVQAALLARFSDKTILIGHSLESDLHALKIIHGTVVDTSVVFPHKMGAPYKRALKNLAAEYLKRIIQDDVSGHDSAEDAIACLHLMQWKVKEDMKGFSK